MLCEFESHFLQTTTRRCPLIFLGGTHKTPYGVYVLSCELRDFNEIHGGTLPKAVVGLGLPIPGPKAAATDPLHIP